MATDKIEALVLSLLTAIGEGKDPAAVVNLPGLTTTSERGGAVVATGARELASMCGQLL